MDTMLNSKHDCDLKIDVNDNTMGEQEIMTLKNHLSTHGSINDWNIDFISISGKIGLKRLLMALCDHKIFMYEIVVVSKRLISFTNHESNKSILIEFNINIDPNNCNMLEFVDSLNLIFNPRIKSVSFGSGEGDILNSHIIIDLND